MWSCRGSTLLRGSVLFCIAAATVTVAAGCGSVFYFLDGEAHALTLVLTAERYQLSGQTAATAGTSLRAVAGGGWAPYDFRWSVTDPAGEPADELLYSLEATEVRFTPATSNGPYAVRCTVRDNLCVQETASLIIQVGSAVGLDVTTERVGVVAGGGPQGQATLHLTPESGTPPFEITWTVTGPDGQTDNARLDTSNPLAPIFTSGERVGTYILTATIVDADGTRSTESVIVVVGQDLGLDVIASRASVLPGGGSDGTATLLATPIGGHEPYAYDWEVLGPDGGTHNELLWDREVRSPEFESGDTAGTFLARCAVTDADGTVLIGSTTIVVGQAIGLDVIADRLALPAGSGSEQATLNADVRGGREPVSLQWSAVGPDGE